MIKNNIKISKVFWSVDDLKFADDVLILALNLKKEKSTKNFNIYVLPDNTQLFAFSEKNNEVKLHDSYLELSAPKNIIINAFEILKKLGYDCHLNQSERFGISTLSCFAPSPNRNCEVVIFSDQK